jgi:hypothetical protein
MKLKVIALNYLKVLHQKFSPQHAINFARFQFRKFLFLILFFTFVITNTSLRSAFDDRGCKKMPPSVKKIAEIFLRSSS